MKYACVFYADEKLLDSMSKAELDALTAKAAAWVEDLKRGGHYVLSLGLQTTKTATTLREAQGKLSMTDGPFAETKEQLGGITVIEARDLNEALLLAGRSPCKLGCIEVRPLMSL